MSTALRSETQGMFCSYSISIVLVYVTDLYPFMPKSELHALAINVKLSSVSEFANSSKEKQLQKLLIDIYQPGLAYTYDAFLNMPDSGSYTSEQKLFLCL